VGRFKRWRERKVDHFEKYKEAQVVKVERVVTAHQRSKKEGRLTKKERGAAMRDFKRKYGLNRSQMGAIGAGHKEAPWAK